MTGTLKQEYTRRITQANQSQLIVILYDIALTYLQDAKKADHKKDLPDYQLQLENAGKCIEEMIKNLHFAYEPARSLQQIYLSMKKTIREARLTQNSALLDTVISNLTKLHDAYQTAAVQDTSAPVMAHAQTVVAGLTYGKNTISEDLAGESSNRGFRV